MGMCNNFGAYNDCIEILDQALSVRLRLTFDTYGDARYAINRFNYARKLARDISRTVYQPGEPDFNKCVYDVLTVRYPVEENGRFVVYIEQRRLNCVIEELP